MEFRPNREPETAVERQVGSPAFSARGRYQKMGAVPPTGETAVRGEPAKLHSP